MQSSTGLRSIGKDRNGESIGERKATLESSFVSSYASGAGSALGRALEPLSPSVSALGIGPYTHHMPAIERSYQLVAVFRLRANEKKAVHASRVRAQRWPLVYYALLVSVARLQGSRLQTG